MAARQDTTQDPTQDTTREIDKAADAGRAAADEAARTTQAVAQTAVQAGGETARAGADAARRNAETLRDNVRSGLDTATQTAQRAADQFLNVFDFPGPRSEHPARGSSQTVDAVWQASTVLARAFQEVSQEWIGLVQDQVTRNIDAVHRLARCRSMGDVLTLQSELVRDNLRQAIEAGRRVTDVSLRAAAEAARVAQAEARAGGDRTRPAAYR